MIRRGGSERGQPTTDDENAMASKDGGEETNIKDALRSVDPKSHHRPNLIARDGFGGN